MKLNIKILVSISGLIMLLGCSSNKKNKSPITKDTTQEMTAAKILGNPNYLAISYGGYRKKTREIQPTIPELKEDLKLLHAMGIRILRTYNVQPNLPHASNILKAISQLKKEDANFKMYVMLGAWIDCINAWTDKAPNHDVESDQNEG